MAPLLLALLSSCSSLEKFQGENKVLHDKFSSSQSPRVTKYVVGGKTCFPDEIKDDREIFTARWEDYRDLMYQLFASEVAYTVKIQKLPSGGNYRVFEPSEETRRLEFEVYYCHMGISGFFDSAKQTYASFRIKK